MYRSEDPASKASKQMVPKTVLAAHPMKSQSHSGFYFLRSSSPEALQLARPRAGIQVRIPHLTLTVNLDYGLHKDGSERL